MDSNHPRRLYESRVLPTELASRLFPRKLAGRAGFEPAHGVSNSHVPFQLGYRPKTRRPRFCRGLRELESEILNANHQTNPEGPARLTRRLIMDLVRIVIFETQYSTLYVAVPPLHSLSSSRKTSAESGVGRRQKGAFWSSGRNNDREKETLRRQWCPDSGCMPSF